MEQTVADKLQDLAGEVSLGYPENPDEYEELREILFDLSEEVAEIEDKAWKYEDLQY